VRGLNITIVSYNKRCYFISSFPFLSCIDVTPCRFCLFSFSSHSQNTRGQVLEDEEWKFRNSKYRLVNAVESQVLLYRFLPYRLHICHVNQYLLFFCEPMCGCKSLKVLISAASVCLFQSRIVTGLTNTSCDFKYGTYSSTLIYQSAFKLFH
jgi:hypothetical protein